MTGTTTTGTVIRNPMATDWRDLLLNPVFLRKLYPLAPPSLEAIDLHEAALHRDGPALRLRFDLRDFPLDPPAAWRTARYDVVQVTLLLIGIRAVELSGWSTSVRGTLRLDREAEGSAIAARFMAPGTTIRATADAIHVDAVSAYAGGSSR